MLPGFKCAGRLMAVSRTRCVGWPALKCLIGDPASESAAATARYRHRHLSTNHPASSVVAAIGSSLDMSCKIAVERRSKGIIPNKTKSKWQVSRVIDGIRFRTSLYDRQDTARLVSNRIIYDDETIQSVMGAINDMNLKTEAEKRKVFRKLVDQSASLLGGVNEGSANGSIDEETLQHDDFGNNVNLDTGERKLSKSLSKSSARARYSNVSWEVSMKKWRARVTIQRVAYLIGYYDSEQEAARAVASVRDDDRHMQSLRQLIESAATSDAKRAAFAVYIQQHIDESRHIKRTAEKGVYWHKLREKFAAEMRLQTTDDRVHLGCFDTEEKATEMLRLAQSDLHRKALEKIAEASVGKSRKERNVNMGKYIQEHVDPTRRLKTSKYHGVMWHPTHKMWHVKLKLDSTGVFYHVGRYEDETDAAAMVTKITEHHAADIERILSLAGDDPAAKRHALSQYIYKRVDPTKRVKTSVYPGVSWAPHSKKWVARICSNGKTTALGSFVKEEDARDAYLEAKNVAKRKAVIDRR
jgi:AP2 domain